MRVCAVVGTPDYTGGSRVVLNYLAGVNAGGGKVAICLCPPRPRGVSKGFAEEAAAVGIPVTIEEGVDRKVPFRGAFRAARLLRQLEVDTLVASNVQNAFRFAAIVKAISPRVRLFVIANNEMSFAGRPWLHFLKRGVYKSFLRYLTDGAVFASVALKERICGLASDDPRFVVIRNSVDLAITSSRGEERTRIRRELGVPEDVSLVLYCARISRQKDPITFVRTACEAVRAGCRVRFVIAGQPQSDDDRSLETGVRQLIEAEQLTRDVQLLGWRDDVSSLLAASDIYLSTAVWEGLPLGIAEAMSFSIPVVTTDFSSARELVEEGVNGFVCPVGDSGLLARRIISLVRDSGLRREMGIRGRNRAEALLDLSRAKNAFVETLRGDT